MKKQTLIQDKRLFYGLLAALILTFWLLRGVLAPLANDINKSGIIGFELAHSLERSQIIMDSWDASATRNAKLSLYYDFIFLAVYSSFFALVIARIYTRLSPTSIMYRLGVVLCVGAFLAGLADIIENIALLQLLRNTIRINVLI